MTREHVVDVTASGRSGRPERVGIVVVHEVLGVNAHVQGLAEALRDRTGCDVHVPDLGARRRPFSVDESDEAYRSFMDGPGIAGMHAALLRICQELRRRHEALVAVGFSVGATAAWLASDSGLLDGVVGAYGSRIRDHLDVAPSCPCLLTFSRREASFDPQVLAERLAAVPQVDVQVVDAGHGFCNPENPAFDEALRDRVADDVVALVRAVGAR